MPRREGREGERGGGYVRRKKKTCTVVHMLVWRATWRAESRTRDIMVNREPGGGMHVPGRSVLREMWTHRDVGVVFGMRPFDPEVRRGVGVGGPLGRSSSPVLLSCWRCVYLTAFSVRYSVWIYTFDWAFLIKWSTYSYGGRNPLFLIVTPVSERAILFAPSAVLAIVYTVCPATKLGDRLAVRDGFRCVRTEPGPVSPPETFTYCCICSDACTVWKKGTKKIDDVLTCLSRILNVSSRHEDSLS